jgi:hypothetical protein
MNTDKLTIQDIAPYLPYGIEVEYEGILNGDEIKAYNKAFEKEHGDDFFATNQDYYKPPEKIIGKKIGYIKEVGFFLEYTRYRIGKKGLQTHNNTDKFKPILYPISCLTKEITHNGERFIPIVELAKIAFPDRCWEIDGNGVAKAEYFDDPIQFWYSHMAKGFCNNWKPYTPNQFQLFQKLAEWHIDFMGLIEKGLAIDKSTLKL